MPLVRSWWLGRKKGREAYVVSEVVRGEVRFTIGHDTSGPATDGTMTRGNGVCVACNATAENAYIRKQATSVGLGQKLMAVVVEGNRQRNYLAPTLAQSDAAAVDRPDDVPDQVVPTPNHDVDRLPMYGMPRWSDAFTNRQLVALTTFSDLAREARERVLIDTRATGQPEGSRLDGGGSGAAAYADAVTTYLAYLGSKLADWLSSLCSWIPQIEGVRDTFARQALPMVWDFVEINPFSNSVGNAGGHFEWISSAIENFPAIDTQSDAVQFDAAKVHFAGGVVATDPPYYDNIGYSDLSDYFYVWLRRSLKDIHPSLFTTLLVPKAEELVANPNRHDGKQGAKRFFEEGFREVFRRARETASPDFPITVYYAFKQSQSSDDGEVSSGWETLLDGMVKSGWQITATWPLRSEKSGRMISVGTNALASSIVLSLRPRPEYAPPTDRPGFISALKAELGEAMEKLQAGGIAPVDLPQAAIGPGMAVFSRYSAVREFDGSQMSVRAALARINEVLDEVLSEQEGDFDAATRFCIAWFRQHGYSEGKYGDAELLGNARGIAVDTLKRHGVLHSAAGKVRLFRPSDLLEDYDVLADDATSDWEALHYLIRLLEADGVDAGGAFLAQAGGRPDGAVHPDLLPELAHLLFRVSEDNRWTKEAISFNQLVTAWTDIHVASRAAAPASPTAVQEGFDFSGE
jgi:putative DNA methylase